MPVVEGPDGIRRRAFSADDVRRMTEIGILGENDPFELVDGELIAMAAKGFAHDRLRDALTGLIFRATSGDLIVSVEGTLQLDDLTLLEPELLVYREGDAAPSAQGYKMVPGRQVLLAVEISVSSLAYDRRRKASRYAAYGIGEYWVIDVSGARTFVHTEPGSGAYRVVRESPATDLLVPQAGDLAHLRIRLADLL